MAESRSVTFNLIGINRSSRAFRGAADDADRLAGRLDRADKSSAKTSKTFEALTGSTATMAAGLLTVAPAALAAGAAVTAAAGAMAAAYGAAGAALGAFSLAVRPQLEGVAAAADAHAKAQEASAEGGAKAAAANKAYAQSLAKLPPATRETAKAFIGLKGDFKAWSDSLAGDTMPVFTSGINVARGLLPKLTPLVKTASKELGKFMDTLAGDAKGKGVNRFIASVNKVAGPVLGSMLRSARNVAKGVGGIFEAFLPHAPAMASGIEGLTAKFARWGQSLKSSESFKTFIGYVKANLPALQTTFGNLVQIVVNLAAAFAPMSGISLELIKHFTGILAALPPEVLTALATGFVAVSMAMRVLNPLIRVFNILMRLNPIGIVVLALAGLAFALYTAYKRSETFRNIVNKVWSSVKSGVWSAWTEYIRPALRGLSNLMRDAKATWQDVWDGYLAQALADAGTFFRDNLAPAIETVTEALGRVAGKAGEASGALLGVGGGFDTSKEKGNSFLSWSRIFGTSIGTVFLGPLGGVLGGFVGWFWPQTKAAFSEGFGELKRLATAFGRWLPGALSAAFTKVAQVTRDGLVTLWVRFTDGLKPPKRSLTGFFEWIPTFAKRLLSVAGSVVSDALSAMRRAFDRGVDAMKSAFGRLPGGVKVPVNWVIDHAYNKGIRNLWNKVMGWLKLPGGMQLGSVPLLAAGGPVPAATAGWANKPTAIYGEGSRRHPEVVIPTDPKYRARAQGLWAAAGGKLQMLERGGVLGSVLGGVKAAAGKIGSIGKSGMDLLTNPKGLWDSLAAKMVPGAGHLARDKWGTAISKVPPMLLQQAWNAASQIISTFKKAFGGDASGVVKAAASMIGRGDDRGENNNWLTRNAGMPGAPWCALFVSEAIRQAKATKKYRGYPSAAVASFVGGMRHVGRGEGRPGDLGAYRGTGHINVIAKNLGGGMYETIGGNEGPVVRRGTRGGQSAILRPMASGGILGVFEQRNLDPADGRDPFLRGLRAAAYDSGGMLQPGVTLAVNNTGKPEPVFTSLDAAASYGGGREVTVNLGGVVVEDRADVDMLAARLGFAVRSAAF